jgi:putative cell wall-binding protein
MSMHVRPTRALLGALALIAALWAPLAAPARGTSTASTTTVEVQLTELLNAARAERGLPGLRVDVRLVDQARTWSRRMAADGQLSHDPGLAQQQPAGTTAAGENVAFTSRADDTAAAHLHGLMMDSASHRANILDDRYTDVGIGIVENAGRTYATVRFSAGAPAQTARAVSGLSRIATRLFDGDPGNAVAGAGTAVASHAVIVRDDVFADALSAGPLAGSDGPLLLNPPGPALHPLVRLALERTLPRGRTVWLVGGTDAVSAGVESELTGAGYQVRRISGGDRVGTAASVAREVVARDGRPDRVVVATADDWPDAVASGAYGARSGAPVLLTGRDAVPEATARALTDLRPANVTALGGSEAISDGVVSSLGASRTSGRTRQGTAAAAAADLWGYRDSSPARWIAVPAFGDDAWTWALGAAPLSARTGAAVLLVGAELDTEVRSYLGDLGYGGGRTAELLTVGPVPSAAAGQLQALLR